jgi:hypothetical protein
VVTLNHVSNPVRGLRHVEYFENSDVNFINNEPYKEQNPREKRWPKLSGKSGAVGHLRVTTGA